MQWFAQRLKHERELHLWSQEQVAEMIGTTAPSVSRWERGSTLPGFHFRQKLCELFGKSAEELGLVQEDGINERRDRFTVPTAEASRSGAHFNPSAPALAPTTSSAIWHVPYRRNPFFTNREDVLAHLYKTLHAVRAAALTQAVALSGLGGIGKTQTVAEYAYRFRSEYQAVLWAQAETHEVLQGEFMKLAAVLNLPEKNEHDQGRVVAAVKQWLSDHLDWLLILDNAEDLSILHDFIPFGGKGHILLTTRTQSTSTFAQRINLEQMEPDAGALFLLRRAVYIECDAPLEEASHADYGIAREISQLVGGLPLALDQAGAYIEETACSLSDYLERYQTQRAALLNLRDFRGGTHTTHPQSVGATFRLSFELVERTNPAAADLLRLCAFLHADAIPETILRAGAPDLGPTLQPVAADPLMFDAAIAALRTYSLLRRNSDTKMFTIHCLVQAVLKDSMDAQAQRLWAERALKAVNRDFPLGTK